MMYLAQPVKLRRTLTSLLVLAGLYGLALPSQAADEALDAASLKQQSDTELTAIIAKWSDLQPADRRVLLAEVRTRMSRQREAQRQRRAEVLPGEIKVQRRYGRIVRKADGSVVVQTIVQERRAPRESQRSRVTFGFGFERRADRRQLAGQSQPAEVDQDEAAPHASQQSPVSVDTRQP